jgi:hypothetical protein
LRARKPYQPSVKQGIDDKKYFDRAIHQYVERTDVRDQKVIYDLLFWMKNRGANLPIVQSVYEGGEYLNTFDTLAPLYMSSDQELVYAFGEQVFDLMLSRPDSLFTDGELGKSFFSIKSLMRRSPGLYQSDLPLTWLTNVSIKSLKVSIPFVNELYSVYGASTYSILSFDQSKKIRASIFEAAKASIKTGADVVRLFNGTDHFDLLHFVYPSSERSNEYIYNSSDFNWLAKPIIEALQLSPGPIAKKLARLIFDISRSSDLSTTYYIANIGRLFTMFFKDSLLVLRAIEAAIPSAECWEKDSLIQTAQTGLAKYFEMTTFLSRLFFFYFSLWFQSLWLFPSNQNGPDGDNSVIGIEDPLFHLVEHLGELIIELTAVE